MLIRCSRHFFKRQLAYAGKDSRAAGVPQIADLGFRKIVLQYPHWYDSPNSVNRCGVSTTPESY
jgi:hypothetical protein